MNTVVINRSPRRPAPEIPSGELPVPAPPEVPQAPASRWQQLIQVVPMLTGTIATAFLFAGRDGGTYAYVVGAIFGFSTLGMLLTGGTGGPRKSEMTAARRAYLRQLAALRDRVRETATKQRTGLHYRHPDPHSLWSTVDSYRLWERRPSDGDFAVVRVAAGPQTLATPLIPPPARPPEELEPTTAAALRRFLDAYSVVPDLPVAISLRSFARIHVLNVAVDLVDPTGVTSFQDPGRALVRAMVAQLIAFHAAEDLLIAVCAAPRRRAQWEWTKWLPHAQHPARTDALGPVRLFAESAKELEERLDDLLGSRGRFDGEPSGDRAAGPHIVVVLDGGDLSGSRHLVTPGGLAGVTVIDLDGPPPRLLDRSAIVLEPSGGRLTTVSADSEPADVRTSVGVPDQLEFAEVEAIARRLAPVRLAAPAGDKDKAGARDLSATVDLAELLGLGDPRAFDVATAWAPRPHRDRLRVTIGIGQQGQPVDVDLKESAQDGMGPHGLLIGATGSGKSELLRTLVLGLAATHSSETLNFVLIDFKGGATFARMDRLPHVAAFITNLRKELPLVDRMTDAINGEVVRRQEVLRRAGDFDSVLDYERARAGGAALAPLPTLLIVCDEFSELLEAKPDFIDLFVQIGRVGRSLGMHLLLASQRLEEGRLRGLDTHLSYRLGLRTFSSLESRTVLGVPDAYELPRTPGHGYLKAGTEPLTRFKAAYVSGRHRRAGEASAPLSSGGELRVREFGTRFVPPPPQAVADPPPVEAPAGDSLLDIIVERLAGRGAPAHQVWLPPLSGSASLNELLGPLVADPARGLTVADPDLRGSLRVPVALVDKPLEQRRDVLWMHLDSADGHVAVVGGTQSGKSVALRTLIAGLALTHTPTEVQVYCLDFGGGQLAGLRGLPHVGGVAGRLDATAVRRTVGEVATLLADRERRFAGEGIDSVATYRRRRAAAAARGAVDNASAVDPWGDVFLVVDGWATVHGEYEDLEGVITDIATRGLSYGIHVAASASRWMDFRPALRDLLGSRLELRLGDEIDSTVSRKAAANVPKGTPGRGITQEGLHLLVAQPRLASGDTPGLVSAVADAWAGARAPRVRLLPARVPFATIAEDADPANRMALPIGIAESDLRPVRVDFAAEPHFVVFGDAESGKSTVLRGLATSISARFAPEEARIVLVDYRRSLLGAIETEHLIGYGTGAAQTEDLIASVADYMERRLPGPDVTQDQLRTRGWWTGAECFVLVDDYDLVATGSSNPLQPLLPYLAQARDIGLHLILTRRTGGASRALYEPILQRLRELSSAGLQLSGDPDEGTLLGAVRPGPLPPGRGWLTTRRAPARLIQVASPPST
ncbi:type VII secretion protein EccCa [Dactylosporangium sucinum]|uniref:Type VII secretion protein EccC n=1 Tax=Dactylosporangium sucinum TaxID=1424081 RepID=A0A917TQT2_9ACTN|nr:type VII secretion protein EccCa [Dactylosporangium sucinum]GGM33721.1 type VII secretion protein EccC [Dactylosporangium sucinum]